MPCPHDGLHPSVESRGRQATSQHIGQESKNKRINKTQLHTMYPTLHSYKSLVKFLIPPEKLAGDGSAEDSG